MAGLLNMIQMVVIMHKGFCLMDKHLEVGRSTLKWVSVTEDELDILLSPFMSLILPTSKIILACAELGQRKAGGEYV